MSFDSEDAIEIVDDLDIEEDEIDPEKLLVEFLTSDEVPGIDSELYKQIVASENLTPEERQAALSRPIQRRYSSIAGLNFTLGNDATPRIQMFCSHNTQRLVFEGMTPKNIINGTEQEFGKFNFRTDVKNDCKVHEVIFQYNKRMSKDTIEHNPRTFVITQLTDKDEPGHFDVIVLEDYCSMHQHFGFRYKDGKDTNKLFKGSVLNKGDVLRETPSTTSNGDYMFGRELKAVMMTHRSVAEDGIAICEDVLDRFAFHVYEERRVSFGKKTIPLNIYGTETEYKIFPDIGEDVRSDDILMSTRQIDPETAISSQNRHSTRQVDYIFDESVYVVGGGKVISIDVTCNNESEGRISDMEQQLRKYHDQSMEFYKKIIALDKRLRTEYQTKYYPSPALASLVIEATVATNFNNTVKVSKLYRRDVMDDFTIKFVVEKRVVPTFGFKFTDTRGRKGVCCAILPRDQMPVDKNGVSADIIVDPMSCINRMIMGGPIEAGINVITDIVTKLVRDATGVDFNSPHAKNQIKVMSEMNDPRIDKAWQHAVDYYKVIAPESMYPKALTAQAKDKAVVLTHTIKNKLGLYLPPENSVNFAKALNQLHSIYKPEYGSVHYYNKRGTLITSKDSMCISDNYMMLLEKIGDDRSAVSSVKFQVFGVPATISKHDRFTSPVRLQPGKIQGESEARPINCITRPSVQAELIDRNNNPKSAEMCYRVLLRAANPSKIEKLIDRAKHPFGFTMPIQIFNHFTLCSGYQFVYKNDNQGLYTYSQMVQENN